MLPDVEVPLNPPTQNNASLLRPFAGAPSLDTNSGHLFPIVLHHNGRTGGPYILYAESAEIRLEWKNKLEEAIGLRKILQESNMVFEIEYLSRDTFIMPPLTVGNARQPWNHDIQFTGKVTCSFPFSKQFSCAKGFNETQGMLDTSDGRELVSIGCFEGVWIGFRHDPKCRQLGKTIYGANRLTPLLALRCVLHLKKVTQCAMLEGFDVFLVLADKVRERDIHELVAFVNYYFLLLRHSLPTTSMLSCHARFPMLRKECRKGSVQMQMYVSSV